MPAGAGMTALGREPFMIESKKILVGKIVAPQGLRGEVRVQTYTQNPMDFAQMDVGACCARPGVCNTPLQLKFIRVLPNSSVVIMKAEGTDDRNAVESLRGVELFIDRAALPEPAAGEYYIADLIGMKINCKSQIANCKVAAVHNFGAGDILELDNGDMVSFAGAKVDMEKREITMENQNGR